MPGPPLVVPPWVEARLRQMRWAKTTQASAAYGGVGVKVVGLSELRRACSVMGEEMRLYLREELKKLAGVVVTRTKPKIPVITGAAAGSVRAVIAGGGAAVRAGSAAVPYYGWLDFGGIIRHYPHANIHHTMQHLIKRPFIREGRYLYPTADESAVEMAPMVEAMLDRLAVKAGWV